ncbi:hypothetical protein L249_2587 [Ophiocordyceps polyrhachis-furcata BCC 54312]|uniref:Uncharacterized protein n=1 Tax=Ophiocordyceps polyrhachis-furcata BCC 54312 TaxID=1330021 RepID=A0A367LPD8_9HYPO|nr:hypothetical protein L249_2587 [Ophiocordyceps polyrhachis-furcata BCC 54312]
MMGRHPSAFDFAAAALLLLTAVAAVVVVLCAICLARRRGDAVRSWIVCYRAALAFFVLAIILTLAKHLLAIVYREFFDVSIRANASAVVGGLLQAQVETNIIGALLHELALIFLLLALVGLALGVGIAHAGRQSGTDKIVRLASYAIGGVLVILDVVAFSFSEKVFVVVYAKQDVGQQGVDAPETTWQVLRANKVTLPMLIIQLILALAVFVQFVVVAVRTRSNARLRMATAYLGLCAVLLLLKTSYDVGFYTKYVPPDPHQHPADQTSVPPPYFVIVNLLLSIWPIFFVLVALLVLAAKKQRGLWATDHPLAMHNNSPHDMPLQTPWGYNYSPQSQQPLQPASYSPVHYPGGPGSPHPPPEGHYAQFRRGSSPPPQWHEHHHQHAYAGSVPSSPPPPAHSEAMGLYHQADGMPPQVMSLPYDEKGDISLGPKDLAREH